MAQTALIVEDNDLNLRLFKEIMSLEGFSVITATDGLRAMEMLAAYEPDIVLLDLQLPRLSGLAVARRVREHPDLQSVPVIAVSAFTSAADRLAALQAGCTDYLTKPVAPVELVGTVRRCVGHLPAAVHRRQDRAGNIHL